MSSSYTFKWEHPATEVYVTGDFDGWKKTEKLTKTAAGHFEKSVVIPTSDTRHEYKFFVDGEWKYNPSLPTESDGAGNVNNVLHQHDLVPTADIPAISSAAPLSSTAALAAGVPKEKSTSEEVPGAFPETPGFETPMTEPSAFSVNPFPASSGIGNPIKLAAGEPIPDAKSIPSTGEPAAYGVNPIPASAGIGNPIKLAPGEPVPDSKAISSSGEESAYGVKPIPASAGVGNPIHLAPGEPVPHSSTIGDHTVGSTVKTDKESYEKSDAGIAGGAAALGAGGLAAGSGMFGVPPVTSGMIPESSLPMGAGAGPVDTEVSPFMQSAHPESTTAALAGAVPLEPRGGVPAEVVESQKEAHVSPEASANPEAVVEKKEVESELLSKVHEAPAASPKADGGITAGGVAAAVGGAAAAAGAAAASVAAATYSKLPAGVQQSIDDINSKATAATSGITSSGSTSSPTAAAVPETVTDSIAAAHASPEAAANPTAVAEKSAMESELESKIAPVTSAGEPAPTAAAATSVVAPAATTSTAAAVPETVSESIAAAHSSPEAAANPTAVAEKSAVEAELAGKVSPVEPAAPSTQTAPVVTTGVQSSTAEPVSTGTGTSAAVAEPSTPTKLKEATVAEPATPASATGTEASGTESAKEKKKKKRFSVFIDKIKDKLK